MQNRDKKRARRQEILRRLSADEELLNMTRARQAPDEEERQRKLEIQWELERNKNSGAWAGGF